MSILSLSGRISQYTRHTGTMLYTYTLRIFYRLTLRSVLIHNTELLGTHLDMETFIRIWQHT